jgi:hypothetical protein
MRRLAAAAPPPRKRLWRSVLILAGIAVLVVLSLRRFTTQIPSLSGYHQKTATDSGGASCEGERADGPTLRFGRGSYRLENPRGALQDAISPERLGWSQYGQDLWVDTYFGQKRNGIFVEVGGYDGETHSNTLFLEKERGWQGLLIEANPYSFELMQAKDRLAWMAHTCIKSQNHSELHFRLAGGITSALELSSQQHAQRIQHDLQLYRRQRNWKGAGETWCMPCYSFELILQRTELWKETATAPLVIDFFSIDVEGAELELLQSLDFENGPVIRLFVIEMQENAAEIRRFMDTQNFQEIATVGIDSVFVPKTARAEP